MKTSSQTEVYPISETPIGDDLWHWVFHILVIHMGNNGVFMMVNMASYASWWVPIQKMTVISTNHPCSKLGESPPYPPALHLRPLVADHLRRQVVAPSQGLRSAEAAQRGAGEAPAADGSIAGAVAAQQGAAAEGAGDGGLGNRQWRNGGEIKVSNLKH